MLLYTGLILTVLLGYSLLNLISRKFSWVEKLGLSFLLGIALQTLLMLIMDAIYIPLTATSTMIGEVALLLLLNIPTLLHSKEIIAEIKKPNSGCCNPSSFNLVWLLFVGLTVYFEYMNFSKCLYFPAFDRDSLAGFETIGYIVAQEHTLRGLSLFQGDYMPGVHGPGSYITYAPMVQLSYAYVYLLGATTSKLIPGLIYLFFLITFYGCTSRIAGKMGAAIITFFVLITPEMMSFSSLSMTNVIHAVYASLGVIYLTLWLKEREQKDLWLGSALLGANMWCRTEGIVFIGAVLCVMLVDAIRKKQYKSLIICTAISLLPALLWVIFMKIYGLYAEGIAIITPFYDSEKINIIWTYMKDHWTNTTFYGWSFVAFALSLLVNAWFLIKKRDNSPLLIIILLASVFYMIVLYQIDYKWDSIQNVLAYSAKRFMFCFIPLLWYFVATNQTSVYLFKRLEKYLAI